MITEHVLNQALQENNPQLILEEILSAEWLHPNPPVITVETFYEYEQRLLDKALNEKPLSWWNAIWDVEPSVSWRRALNQLLINCAVRYTSNLQWLDVWNKEDQNSQSAYQLAYQCVVENNIVLLDALCHQPLLRSHPHLYNRLFKDSVRKKCLESFVYLSKHIQNRETPEVVGSIIKECVQLNFFNGTQYMIDHTPQKILRQTYRTVEEFYNMKLSRNYMENDSFILLLTEGRLQENISKDVWLKVSTEYLNGVFTLYMSDIVVYRLSPRILPSMEEVMYAHKHWNGLRMKWLEQTLNSAPTSSFLSSGAQTMKTKWVKMLLPSTTASERKVWIDSNHNLRANPALNCLFEHPLMQKTLLRYELQDEIDGKSEKSHRKI